MGTSLCVALFAALALLSGPAAGLTAAQALPGSPGSTLPEVTRLAAATTGAIAGTVVDQRGRPLADAVISAVGGTTAFAVTDEEGRFTLRALMPGPYLVRAHLEGYAAERGTIVVVRPSARATSSFTLRRLDDGELVAAGLAGIGGAPGSAEGDERDGSETVWRLLRLRRSILRDAEMLADVERHDAPLLAQPLHLIGRAVESSARLAGSWLANSALQGQVNLLATGAFNDPGELLRREGSRGVAFFAFGARVGTDAEWKVRAALNQGDLSAWLVTGDYVARAAGGHRYRVGLSYGVHRYDSSTPVVIATGAETARNVGAVYGYDEWTINPTVTLGYGVHYARYDYLNDASHVSPRIDATVHVGTRTDLRAIAVRRVDAPGAEEFLPPSRHLLPPQRTFSPLTRSGFVPQDLQHYEIAVEHSLERATLGLRAFQQRIDDQRVTVFGLRSDQAVPADFGHYFVGSAGDVDVQGWSLSVSHAVSAHVRGSIEYTMADAEWANHRTRDRWRLARVAPAALRDSRERVHDITTSVETEVPQSATRIFVLYKVNSGFIRDGESGPRPGVDGRWDLQVNQGLPFLNFSKAEWEMLLAVRNLFREALTEASVYDELLVARAPKRLVGGVTVKF
jgi:hypothetical protein